MLRLIHISVILAVGGLSGCLKKKKSSHEPAPPPSLTGDDPSAHSLMAESTEPQRTLSIEDPLQGLGTVGVWRPIKKDGAPLPCPEHTRTFWTGSHFLVFGQLIDVEKSAKCIPQAHLWEAATDSWKSLPAMELSPGSDFRMDQAEVFLLGTQLFVVLPHDKESKVLDLTAQSWKPAPPWLPLAVWGSVNSDHKESKSHDPTLSVPGDRSHHEGPTPYVVDKLGLVTWKDNLLKVYDWSTGIPKDASPLLWSDPHASVIGNTTAPTDQSLLTGQNVSPVIVYGRYFHSDSKETQKSSFAVSENPTGGAPWQVIQHPIVIDSKGQAKCADVWGALTTVLEGKIVIIGVDNTQDELRSSRTCFTTIDLQSGAITQTGHLLLSQLAGRNDGSYEYLDLRIQNHVRSGRRIVYRLKRDGGLVSISDNASQGFAFQGYEERFLVYDPTSGAFAVTPSLNGSGNLERTYMVGTERGFILWGGHQPLNDGSESSSNEGSILEWPL